MSHGRELENDAFDGHFQVVETHLGAEVHAVDMPCSSPFSRSAPLLATLYIAHPTSSSILSATAGDCPRQTHTRIMAQSHSAPARFWRILAGALGKPTVVPRGLPISGAQIPEGTNDDYKLFCRLKLGDRFNDER